VVPPRRVRQYNEAMNLHLARVFGACLAAASALAQATPARDDAPDAGERAGPEIRWRWEALPSHRVGLSPPLEPGLRIAPGGAAPIDYRLWVGHRSAELGIGLLPAAPHAGGGYAFGSAPAAALTLGMRYQVSPQTRLTFDTELSRAAGRSRPLALELASSSPLQGLARGTLMRAQLSADSSLTLRLHGGKLGLYLGVRLTGDE
jgi:hypothetical protein